MDKKTNRIGLEMMPYRGGKTTLCAGCGHNAISERIIDAFFEMGIDPHDVVKLSGIGCSSKSPAYFLGGSHGFNSVHGRMPSVGTGAMLANQKLIAIGVSGDGDTGAIGIGQFVHLMRRNVPMIYIIEDNGCYGLDQGPVLADRRRRLDLEERRRQRADPDRHVHAGHRAGRVVRGALVLRRQEAAAVDPESGARPPRHVHDRRHLAVRHVQRSRGSTKSYAYAKEHEDAVGEISFVPFFEDISIEYDPGTTTEVKLHDGSRLFLKKVADDYNPTDRLSAVRLLHETRQRGEFATGVLYVEPDKDDFVSLLNLVDAPLATLPLDVVRPGQDVLDEIMDDHR